VLLGIDSMSNFRAVDRDTAYLLPPSVDEWLPADHLARFVVEIVDQLDLRGLTSQYRGSGSEAYHPQMLAALLIYGYATGVHSSRRIEQACYESIAFRFIAANTHPDHDTLCAFRRRFLKELEGLFVQVLKIAAELKLLKLGTVALDGTKVHANASRHNALSYQRANQIETQLQQEVRQLLARPSRPIRTRRGNRWISRPSWRGARRACRPLPRRRRRSSGGRPNGRPSSKPPMRRAWRPGSRSRRTQASARVVSRPAPRRGACARPIR